MAGTVAPGTDVDRVTQRVITRFPGTKDLAGAVAGSLTASGAAGPRP